MTRVGVCRENTVRSRALFIARIRSTAMRADHIIPFAMKSRRPDVEFGELLIGHLSPLLVLRGVQLGIDLQPRLRRRRTDQAHHHLIRLQRLAPASSASRGRTAGVRSCSTCSSPAGKWHTSIARPVSLLSAGSCIFHSRLRLLLLPPLSAVISRPRRPRVPPTAQPAPPAPDRLDRELRRIAADAHADPGLVVPQVVDPVRHGLALARVGEVVRIDLARLALGPPRLPGILEVPQRLLLLGIDRDRRLPPPLLARHAAADVPELGVAVGVAVAPPGSCGWPAGCNRLPSAGAAPWSAPTGCPRAVNSPARRRVLLQVHRSGDCGSPRLTGSTSRSRRRRMPGSTAAVGLRPAPGRRS